MNHTKQNVAAVIYDHWITTILMLKTSEKICHCSQNINLSPGEISVLGFFFFKDFL